MGRNREMILIISINTTILLIFIYVGFLLYKKNYFRYNLLRLDPLEEGNIDKTQLKTNAAINIWLIGDSRIAHWNKKMLIDSNIKQNVVNLGLSGQTSRQVLHRFKNHLEFGIPSWIILEVGINDLKMIGLSKKQSEQISTGCYENIISIIELCRINSIKVICISIFPTGKIEFIRSLIWNSEIKYKIIEINKKLRRYCIENSINYFDAYKLLVGKNNMVRKDFRNGFLHLNNQAYLFLSENLISEYGEKLKEHKLQ
jgi:lysophospholipase L1-like esterase